MVQMCYHYITYQITDILHFDYYKTHAWIKDDIRPMPLKDIPEIIGPLTNLYQRDPLSDEEYSAEVLDPSLEVTVTPEPTIEPEEPQQEEEVSEEQTEETVTEETQTQQEEGDPEPVVEEETVIVEETPPEETIEPEPEEAEESDQTEEEEES